MKRAVFLDRDGVVTEPELRDGRSFAPKRLEEFRVYPDAAAAVDRLRAAGYLVIIITNQPDVGAGLVEVDVVDAMHTRLRQALPIDGIECCYETRAQATIRRKPGPGMLLDAAEKWNIDLSASFMVGDRDSDVMAGRAAGCRGSIFVNLGYTAEPRPVGQAASVADLGEAVDWILAQG
jgi:D-glycero-D-manno-heptose 1,7-bisphosphate phosphatase